MNKNVEASYELTVYNGHTINVNTVTREQALAIEPQSVDHFLSPALGLLGFRTADGQWVEHRAALWPGLGDVGISIIQAIQFNPGEFLSPKLVADITGCYSLHNPKALSARLLALRKVHGESFRQPHFFLSRKAGGFAIAWNPTHTWTLIERID